jgi:hypothetical protein
MIKQKLNITFHNPNSNDELVKLLVKIIAQQKVNELISTKMHIPEPQT